MIAMCALFNVRNRGVGMIKLRLSGTKLKGRSSVGSRSSFNRLTYLMCVLNSKIGNYLLFIAFSFWVKCDYINVYSKSAIATVINYELTMKVRFCEVLVSVLNNQ